MSVFRSGPVDLSTLVVKRSPVSPSIAPDFGSLRAYHLGHQGHEVRKPRTLAHSADQAGGCKPVASIMGAVGFPSEVQLLRKTCPRNGCGPKVGTQNGILVNGTMD